MRFGDHQPMFAKHHLEPGLDRPRWRSASCDRSALLHDLLRDRGLNFQPVDLSSALETLDAPYLPLVVLEGAGVPLDPSFPEQKKILQRCRGLFYLCASGAEARRFNRLLIDAGLIKGF